MPVVVLGLVPSLKLDICPSAGSSVAEEKQHIGCGLRALEVPCWAKHG